MRKLLEKYLPNFFAANWTIGLARCDIKEIIRNKAFNPVIHWIETPSLYEYDADPFIYRIENGFIDIFYEKFSVKENYGNISVMRVDDNFKLVDQKVILDTKTHLSYPLVFREKGRSYVFPEASRSGKLSCYEYDPVSRSLGLLKDIIHLPLVDSTILNHDGKYWIFGTLNINEIDFKLLIFYSDDLLGPYKEHPKNPVMHGLNGSRFGGNFIKVDGEIYRPAQNCEKIYGESLTIYRITLLSELDYKEEPYMNLEMDRGTRNNKKMHSIHTINSFENIVVVDGERWVFAPSYRIFNYLKKKRIFKKQRNDQG